MPEQAATSSLRAAGPPPRVRFDTVSFWLFFVVAWSAWRFLPLRGAKLATLALSLFFYAWWRPEYLGLLGFSALVDYFAAARIHESNSRRARNTWLAAALTLNLGLLAFFKYTPLVVQTLGIDGGVGEPAPSWLADWVVPVGISFYTFQTMSYTLDVHARRLAPCGSFLDFLLYVAFFPQLVAGPIVRAREFLPQLDHRRPLTWQRVQVGLYECICGLGLKMVVADGLAPHVDSAFHAVRSGTLSPTAAWFAAIGFGAQIFADFAGYSGIAIGVARLMGFTMPANFRAPYMSRSLSEFWTRWHITLSRWLRDYLYIGLGGNRRGPLRTYANLLVTMLLGGLWHGASWTYVAWGALHGVGLAIERVLGLDRRKSGRRDPVGGVGDVALRMVRIGLVFVFVHVGWVFFRAPTFDIATTLLERMFVVPFEGSLGLEFIARSPHLFLLLPVIALHAGQAAHEWYGLEKSAWRRVVVAVAWIVLIALHDRGASAPFLYFQF